MSYEFANIPYKSTIKREFTMNSFRIGNFLE